ncbi:type II toxin-antitoxin system RelE/ParE family toxin [Mucilaginibacter sp. L3T2-6]|uniref:type II toxin-antitoxin system RelE/ParE family toxin n=1 Tax=Mucilaginibacter sp. L3T2-6 TaxID=3062491 RepID=UPI002675B5D5|nr:type II toxin-antitoxin system RelE/ParE family toxin [Mucilaginibacter sp. L3T2-6]MDO3644457.1 type II toxin-antitoxin system RelE/ParE family toxin [Mucilaginibacter sp. L3T2-6]MDV6216909.1 type II toxin-antitoxin system RelE/ParE family toxin [Mucilaginibacter sp. L3T2-6]
MQVVIEDRSLGEMARYDWSGKSPYPIEVIKAFRKCLFKIKVAHNSNDLRAIKSLHFEKLKGKKYEGKYSIRLNISYRLIFRIENLEGGGKIEIICIEEISNHYA